MYFRFILEDKNVGKVQDRNFLWTKDGNELPGLSTNSEIKPLLYIHLEYPCGSWNQACSSINVISHLIFSRDFVRSFECSTVWTLWIWSAGVCDQVYAAVLSGITVRSTPWEGQKTLGLIFYVAAQGTVRYELFVWEATQGHSSWYWYFTNVYLVLITRSTVHVTWPCASHLLHMFVVLCVLHVLHATYVLQTCVNHVLHGTTHVLQWYDLHV